MYRKCFSSTSKCLKNYIEAILKKRNNKLHILGAIAIVFVIIIYSYNYFNNTFPYSEGWFVNYVELVEKGMFPYKDFYYYLPPLNLLIDCIFWKLSFGYLIVFRAWYLLERILLYILIYKLLVKFFDWRKVSLVCCFSAILCTADDFDFFGDYNQNVALLTVILTSYAVNFIQNTELRKRLKSLFGAGFILGLMVLTKQTIVVACILVFFSLLVFFCIKEKDHNLIRYVLATVGGMLIPILVCLIILLANGALKQCIDQLFIYVDGKGSVFDILINYFLLTLKNGKAWLIAGILFCVYWLNNVEEIKIKKKVIYFLLGVVLLFFLFVKNAWIRLLFHIIDEYTIISAIFVLSIIPGICLLLFYKLKKKPCNNKMLFYAYVFAIIVQCCTVMFLPTLYHAIYDFGIYKKIFEYFHSIFFYFIIMLFIVLLIYTALGKRKINYQKEIIMIAGGGLALNYATAMAAGLETVASNSMRITLPLALIMLFSSNTYKSKKTIGVNEKEILNNYNFRIALLLFISTFCVIGIMACIAQKSITAYPWWGMKDKPKEEKIYTVDNIPALKGIYFSKEDKEMYENITNLITTNSDGDSIIFGYPYIKIYDILCDRHNSYFVPVFWFDVVGDKYVDILINELEEDLPDIVVWYDIPNAIETHEAIYRNGKLLEQRKIVDIFNKILPEKYECLGVYNDMYVYKLIE